MNKSFLYFCIALYGILAASCVRDRHHPGYVYFNEMKVARAYVSNELPNELGTDHLPQNSFPRELLPYRYDKSEGRNIAKMLSPPSELKYDSCLANNRYTQFCSMCHGPAGNGDGQLITSGKYPYKARLLTDSLVQQMPVGEIYHVVSKGFNLMGAHASMLSPDERWQISWYIRHLTPHTNEETISHVLAQ